MSATSQMAAMLDELMGKARNVDPSERTEDNFEDDDVCKFWLAGFCPNEMFINTKADLGICSKSHDQKYKEQYRSSPKHENLGYEEAFLQFLTKMHNDMQRKIKRNIDRLNLTQSGVMDDASKERLDAKIAELNEKITLYLKNAEALGAEGKVDESQEAALVAERYKTEREQARRVNFENVMTSMPGNLGEDVKPMEVCETCGCFLIVGDAQQRIDEHMTGKQHIGFAKIKATIDEMNRRKELKRKQDEERYQKEREEREAKRAKYDQSARKREDDTGTRRREDRDRRDDKDKRRRRSRSREDDRRRSSSSRHHHSSSRHRDSRDSRHKHGDERRRREHRDEPGEKRRRRHEEKEDGEVRSDREEEGGTKKTAASASLVSENGVKEEPESD